jgi:predicted metalloprotease with PDZ domain
VIGGPALRLATRKVDGAQVRIAAVGRYGFKDRDFQDQVHSVLKIERAFWGERAMPYLVTLSPTVGTPGGYAYSGVGRGDAFALWVDPVTPTTDLRYLLAHEYFHTWNPLLIGRLAEDDTEPAGFWLSEGFTDYYARKLMLSSGLLGAAEFAGLWNEMLRAYAISPVRAAPNSQIVSDFRSTAEMQKLPYQRGAILAAALDHEARRRGSSLDAVMRRMRAMAAAPSESRHADALFPVAYEAVTGLDPRPLIQRHVIDGEPIALPADAFGSCFAVITEEVPAFDRGWDAAATAAAGQVVTGLRPDSPAYAAGLRDGMTIVELLAGRPGDGSEPYLMKVRAPDGPEQVLSFLPAGADRITRQTVWPTPASGCPA